MIFIRFIIGLFLLVFINELKAQQTALKGLSRMQRYNYVDGDDTLKSYEIRALGYFRNTEFFHQFTLVCVSRHAVHIMKLLT